MNLALAIDQVATQRELAARSRRWDALQRARAGNVSSAAGAGGPG